MSTQKKASASLEANTNALQEQGVERAPARPFSEQVSDSLKEQDSGAMRITVAAQPDTCEPPAAVGASTASAGLVKPGTSVDTASSEASTEIANDAPAEPGDRHDYRGTDDLVIDVAVEAFEGNNASASDTAVDEMGSGTDEADPNQTVAGADDRNAAGEAEGRLETDLPAVADSLAGTTDATADDEQNVPQFNSKELVQLLDESSGDLVTREDFDGNVDERAFESEWLGSHNDISRQAIREELLRKGECTAHVDDAGNLLSDPDEYRLAIDLGVRVILCVHRARSEDQKREFILRSQASKRILTYEEQRELKNRLILVRLRLGVDYKSIAKTLRVCPNTVRNVETRAATDPNSKHGITKRDRRVTWSTPENIAEANRLQAENKSNSEIAESLGTTPATIGKLFKTSASEATTNVEDKPGKKQKNSRATSPMQPAPQPIEDITAKQGVPEPHRRSLDYLRKDATAFVEWHKATAEKARADSEADFGHADADVEELNKSILYHIQRANLDTARLRRIVSTGGEADVKEAPAGDSCSDGAGPTEVGDYLLGIVSSVEPDQVFVALPVFGGGVIDNHNDCLAKYAPLKAGGVVRVRVVGFDRKRGLWKLQPQGLQTVAPAPGAIAGSHRDDRCSPSMKLGLKAGPKDKEVF